MRAYAAAFGPDEPCVLVERFFAGGCVVARRVDGDSRSPTRKRLLPVPSRWETSSIGPAA